MTRLAYFSPLPPLASGIADYSAELLPHLAGHFEIELFTEDGYRPDEALAARFPVHSWRAFSRLREDRRYDAALYQLGNNGDFHAGAYRTLLEVPGVVVLHEVVLHHMIRELTLTAGDAAAYLEEVRYCCGRTGHALARRSLETGVPLDAWSYPLFERVVDRSLGVLAHSRSSLARVLASRPLTAARVVPFPWTPDPGPGRPAAELRAELGLPADALVVAAFGFMTRSKRLDVALRAFARLAREVPQAVFLVVGEVSKHYDLEALVPPEVRRRVVVAGRLGMRRFLDAMAVTDVAVNLRYPDAGETSATLVRLLGLGTPSIVTGAGSFAELPDEVCAKVDPDESEEDLLFAYLRELAADSGLRRRMGENARRFIVENHRVEETARAYAAAVSEILAAGAGPFPAVPPLAPYGPEDVLADVVAEVTADMADLGAGEADEELLSGVAEAIAGLGLDRPGR